MEKTTSPSLFGTILASAVAGGILSALVVLFLVGYQPRVEDGAIEIQTPVEATDVSDVVEEVNPAVVSIIISQEVPVLEQYYEEDPLDNFFGGQSPFRLRIPQYRQNGTELKKVGGGSGFVISADGYIVTNAHVVFEDEATYTVVMTDGTTYEAKVIAKDVDLDIALIKVDDLNLPYLSFGDSDALRLGQSVIAIGNALSEFSNSVSVGVVSGLSRSITAGGNGRQELLENVIQTDAAINPGNSGGPLLNVRGEVVGVNVAVARGSENIGFALPANVVKPAIESMKENGRVVRPYIGVRYTLITPELQEKFDLPTEKGALIKGDADTLAVLPDSPAEDAGLKEGDIILEINGEEISATNSLASAIRRKAIGDTITLTILREGDERDVTVTLKEMPQE